MKHNIKVKIPVYILENWTVRTFGLFKYYFSGDWQWNGNFNSGSLTLSRSKPILFNSYKEFEKAYYKTKILYFNNKSI